MKKELNVIEVPASGNKDWGGGAYCIVFLYTKHKGNLVVKGYRDEVDDYIKSNYTHYFANYTLWSEKGFRSIWRFWNDRFYIISPDRGINRHRSRTNYKWRITNFNKKTISFRRFPNRWIPQFDEL